MGEVDVSPEAVADVIDVLHASTEYSIFSTAADLLEALSSALAEAEKERDALALERDSLTQHFSEAQEWMQEVRTACKKATGGNTTFIDDDAARAIYRCMAERDSALSQLAEARGENAWRPIDPNALPDPKRGPYLTTNSPDSRDAFGRPSHVWLVSMFHRTDGPEGPVAAFDRDGYTKIWGLELYAPIPSPPSEGN